MTSKSTLKLCSARQCVFVDIFFKRMIKQLLDSFFADNTYLKLDSIQIYLKNVIQWLFDFAYHWFVWLKHGNTRTEGSSKLSGGLKRRKLNKSSSSVGFLFWECLSPILNVTWQWLLLCHNFLTVSFCNRLMINIHHHLCFSFFFPTEVLLVFLTFLLLNRHLEKSLFKSLDWITSSMQSTQWL